MVAEFATEATISVVKSSYNSKQHWLAHWNEFEDKVNQVPHVLGPNAKWLAATDPVYFAIANARYKFVARTLHGYSSVAEVGCGDGLGAVFLGSIAGSVTCFDINAPLLADCRTRLSYLGNVEFVEHDFTAARFQNSPEPFEALVMLDVLEHIYEDVEYQFLANACQLLSRDGLAIIGTPNVEAKRFASENSLSGHVNLKSAQSLKSSLEQHFSRVILFGMNDEVVHTGFWGMSHYLWAVCFGPNLELNVTG